MPAEKFVDRVHETITESYILHEAWNGNVSGDQIAKNFRSVPIQDFDQPDFEKAISRLERDGHVRREGDNLRTTDDGKEDLQRVERWFRMASDQFGRQRAARTTRG